MRAEDKIKETDRLKYIVNLQITDTLTGVIDFAANGNGYVKVEGIEDDIFYSSKNVKDALQGDTVLIVTYHFKVKIRRFGFRRVLERANDTFCGYFSVRSAQRFQFVVVDKKNKSITIFYPEKIK